MADDPKPVLSAHMRLNGKSVLFIGITPDAITQFQRGGAMTMDGGSFGMPGVKILLMPTTGPQEFKATVTETFRSTGSHAQVIEVVDKSFDPKSSS